MDLSKITVILTSGGLDSFIAYHYHRFYFSHERTIALWVDLGQPYARKEERALQRLGYPIYQVPCPTIGELWGNVPTRDKQVIPGRNLLLATIAASIGADRIWLCALDGEMHDGMPDKNQSFFSLSSGIFTYIFHQFRPQVIIESPFAQMTKAEVIAWGLDHKITPEMMKKTTACYDEDVENCGKCGACFKRWIAFTLNGIEGDFASPPEKSVYAGETTFAMTEAFYKKDFNHYNPKRILETLSALELFGVEIGDKSGIALEILQKDNRYLHLMSKNGGHYATR